VDLVFVVDGSGSFQASGAGNWGLVRRFIADIIDRLTIGTTATRVGLVEFSNFGRNVFYLNTYNNKNDVINAVLNLAYDDGNTNTSGGIRAMHLEQFISGRGDRQDVPNVAIIITDGVSTWDKEKTIPSAIEARNAGITIFSVGVTNAIDENELRLMSSTPQVEGQNYFRSATFDQLNTIVSSIVTQTCSVQSTENLYCKDGKHGIMCFCKYDTCDIRPTNSSQCEDINECEFNNGGCQQICRNNFGTYVCECNNGYTLSEDRRECRDVNECNNNVCSFGQTCINTYGSYYCINAQQGAAAAAALVGVEPAAAGVGVGVAGVQMSTVVVSSVLSAVVAVLVAVAVVMAIRQVRRWRQPKTDESKASSSQSRLPSSARGGVDTFGFSTVSSKFGARPALNMEDDGDTISTSTVDMSY